MNADWVSILVSALSGGGLVQLLNWWRQRRLQQARSGTDIDAAYMDNIQNLRSDLMKSIDENRKLYRAIARLDRTLARASACRYWEHCPVRIELQKSGKVSDLTADAAEPDRKPKHTHTARGDPRGRTAQPGGDAADAEPADEPATGSRLHGT
jgi:hypothetical protein